MSAVNLTIDNFIPHVFLRAAHSLTVFLSDVLYMCHLTRVFRLCGPHFKCCPVKSAIFAFLTDSACLSFAHRH